MTNLDSKLTSESRKEGMRLIAQNIYSILKEKEGCTHNEIFNIIGEGKNSATNRRIYDVLNVLRALNFVVKRDKKYYLINYNIENIYNKRLEVEKLKEIKNLFKFIATRNQIRGESPPRKKLYIPFMIISTELDADVKCESTEDKCFFMIHSNKPLEVIEDVEIIKIIEKNETVSKGDSNSFYNKYGWNPNN